MTETVPGEDAVNRMRRANGKPPVGTLAPLAPKLDREGLLTRAWENAINASGSLVLMGVRRRLNKAMLAGVQSRLELAARDVSLLIKEIK